MYRKVFFPIFLISILLMIAGCSSTGKHSYKQGAEGQTDSNTEGVEKYELKNGQKGIVTIDGKDYAFEVLRINSQNNVTIVLENGKKYHLQTKSAKSVKFVDDLGAATFELYRVIQDTAIIHVRKPTQTAAKAPGKTDKINPSEIKKIQLSLTISQDTTVKLSLEGQILKEIPLPQGTQVNWEAEHSVEIELPEAEKATLEINGTFYKTSENKKALHLFVEIKEGKLIVESR